MRIVGCCDVVALQKIHVTLSIEANVDFRGPNAKSHKFLGKANVAASKRIRFPAHHFKFGVRVFQVRQFAIFRQEQSRGSLIALWTRREPGRGAP